MIFHIHFGNFKQKILIFFQKVFTKKKICDKVCGNVDFSAQGVCPVYRAHGCLPPDFTNRLPGLPRKYFLKGEKPCLTRKPRQTSSKNTLFTKATPVRPRFRSLFFPKGSPSSQSTSRRILRTTTPAEVCSR